MRAFRTVILACLLALCAGAALAADAPQDQRKQTKLGKYVTSVEAYEMWKKNPSGVFIVDVRTPEEYVYLGHPAMAANVPVPLWAGKFDAQRKAFPLAANPQFVELMKQRYKAGDTLILMCRSGHRSAAAVNLLAEAGFTQAYNILDGFEGDPVSDKASPKFSQRVKDGWRNSSLPWTPDLDETLVYKP